MIKNLIYLGLLAMVLSFLVQRGCNTNKDLEALRIKNLNYKDSIDRANVMLMDSLDSLLIVFDTMIVSKEIQIQALKEDLSTSKRRFIHLNNQLDQNDKQIRNIQDLNLPFDPDQNNEWLFNQLGYNTGSDL